MINQSVRVFIGQQYLQIYTWKMCFFTIFAAENVN